jgi:hypothetical protein
MAAGAYTRPLFGSTTHFVGHVGCMTFPQSIKQGDRGGVTKTAQVELKSGRV